MSATELRSPSEFLQQPFKKANSLYAIPTQLPALSPQMFVNSSPDLSVSGSESEHIFGEGADYYMMSRGWNEKDSSLQYRSPTMQPPSSPPRYNDVYSHSAFMGPDPTVSLYAPQDTVGGRYDIFSRLPAEPYLSVGSSLHDLRHLASEATSVDYTDYEDDYYTSSGYDYHTGGLMPPPPPPPPVFPYPVDTMLPDPYRKENRELPGLTSESDYEADYPSDLHSPSFSSAEDNTDFSSPELAQTKTFEKPSPNRKVSWSTAWQPIMTADPVTNAKVTIDSAESELTKLPVKTLDAYVAGRDKDGKYVCRYDGCGKKFGRRYNIRTHIQTHLSDRPHVCSTCNAKFVRHHDLRRHEKKHEGKKPYVCHCGRGFSRQDAMLRHRALLICTGVPEQANEAER